MNKKSRFITEKDDLDHVDSGALNANFKNWLMLTWLQGESMSLKSMMGILTGF
jgi:hypothetical protein